MSELRLRLHDTLTSKLVPLTPRRAGEVGVYTCGPTTYDVAHVGHARAALAPDILVRHLREQGMKVTYVRNITDVDDKILKRAAEQGEAPMALSARHAGAYQGDMRALGCLPPDVEPKVSENIEQIVALIEQLIAAGSAYAVTMPSGARDVYYAVRTFAGYGKLSKRNVEELRVGARVEASEEKRDPLDFALWKGVAGEGWGWDSPWGKGRPGWHIECSAMSTRFLGHGMDVHCGGMDLIFPHHENEIAQSEAAAPDAGPLASIWIHNGFVNVDREKMAKSLGNFVTIRQVYERNDPEALRYFLLTVHYRMPIQFDTERLPDRAGAPGAGEAGATKSAGRVVFPGVLEAERRLDYLYVTLARLEALGAPDEAFAAPAPNLAVQAPPTERVRKELASLVKVAEQARARVDAALDDDLNAPAALAVLGEVAKTANELADLAQKRRKDADLVAGAGWLARELRDALRSAAAPLGLLAASTEAYRARTEAQRLAVLGKTPAQIEALVAERVEARKSKDFARSDAIRAELEADRIELADSPTGTTWRVGI